MPPGRDFAWSGLNTSTDTYVNQHLTGITQQQMQAMGYLGKHLNPSTVIDGNIFIYSYSKK
ncbi:hypothetical protein ACSHU8_05710 [Acinetobacter baumannii]|uniref:hypothetical protein n=1 Tax=Acinetobacter baumannii TaxID=470 RepID=UPI002341966F|nr:hypothetical protein [Acinetobacter baumannii]